MKLNLEFSADEMENFLVKGAFKTLTKLFGSQDPAVAAALNAVQQGLMAIVMAGTRPQGPVARGYYPSPPVGYPPVYGPPPGPGSWPYGPPPGPFGAAAQAQYANGPGTNVRPIREPGAVERCFVIDETRSLEAGWGCHECATYNGQQRTVCRQCGHPSCVPIAPPFPSSTPEPVPS